MNNFQEHIQNTCDECEYATTNQAMECASENNEVVVLRAELFSLPNMTERVIDSIRLWIHIHSTSESIVVQALRLYPESGCSLIVESFASPLICHQISTTTITSTVVQPRERSPDTVTEVLAVIGFLGCAILITVLLLLVLYIGYQHYKKNTAHNRPIM